MRKDKKSTKFSNSVKDIVFTLIVVLFIQSFFIQGYSTPTGSMENTILIGDRMFFNQFLYGGSTPRNIPLTNIKLPFFKIPGIREPRRGDIVNFDFPGQRDELIPSENVQYLKRIIGEPGDIIEIKNRILFVNGIEFPREPASQYSYKIIPDTAKLSYQDFSRMLQNPEYLDKFEITDKNTIHIEQDSTGPVFIVPVPNNKIELLKKEPYIKSIKPAIVNTELKDPRTFPKGKGWNEDNYGPLQVPKKGDVVQLTKENYEQWDTFIKREGHHPVIKNRRNNIY